MIKNYLITALRNIGRNKIYASINVLGLSLALACAMLIILYIKDEVSFDRFHKNVNNIYVVGRTLKRPSGDISYSGSTGLFQGPRFAAAIPEIKSFVRLQQGYIDARHGTNVTAEQVFYADANFFDVFSFPLISGSAAGALQNPTSVVITEDVAKKEFGTVDATGKTMYFRKDSAFVPYTVSAVAKNCPQNSSIRFGILMPLTVTQQAEARNENWFNSFLTSFVVLAPGADIKAVEAKMKKTFEADASLSIKMIKEKYNVKDIGMTHFLQGFTTMHLDTRLQIDGGLTGISNPVYSYILSCVAVFILLIACINFVNLSMAQSIKRAKEIGIRKVIGASREKIMLQFLGEPFVLCLTSFVFGIIIAWAVLPVFNNISNKALAFAYLFDVKLIAGYILLFIATFLLAGFYPSIVLSKYNPVLTLYGRLKAGGKNVLQKSLVVVQFSLASFLIIATAVIFLQFNFLTNQPLGYDDTNLVSVDVSQTSNAQVQLIKYQLTKNTGIVNVAAKNGGQWNTTVKTSNGPEVTFAYETIDENYLPLLNVPVVSGRNFSTDYPGDSAHSILVNEEFVKQAGWKTPIGQQAIFYDGNEKFTVVGVVKDYHYRPLTEKIGPQIFTMKPGNGYGMFLIKIKPDNQAATLAYIEKTITGTFPMQPYNLVFKDLQNKQNYEAEARWKQLLLSSALLTIFIACIGLFGLSVLFAGNKTKEIGIRKVLGASVSRMAAAFSTEFIQLVIIALFISIPFAWMAVSKWLQNYPYRITLSWVTFAEAGLLVVLVALITVSFQAVKAALANPVKSLRSE